ncbi:MAG: lamin tail domain-containing protein, partial [Flavobacteriales bacterium]|nr:lamin tail domain-containing protein [Flavobacteriales bacterium]
MRRTLTPLAALRMAGLALLSSIALTSAAQSITATYDLSGGANDVASFAFNGTAPAGVTFGPLVKVGVTSSGSSGNFRATVWPTGATNGNDVFTGSVDLAKYIAFDVTVAAGYTLDLTNVTFGVGRSGTGTRQWQWRSSVDGYATIISTYTTVNAGLTQAGGVLTNPDANSSWTGNVLDLSGATYQDLGPGTYTFRIYAFNSESTAGTAGLQGNLTITGSLTAPPPEVATFTQLTNGIAASPLTASTTDHALLGFAASSDGSQTLQGLSFNTSINSNGVLTNLRLVRSTDNDYATAGDNTVVGGSFVQNAGSIAVTGLTESLTATVANYFLVADVTGAVTVVTPSLSISLDDAGVTLGDGIVTAFSITGTAYTFVGSGSPTLVVSAVSPSFGNVCINTTLPPSGTFTVEGVDLVLGEDVVVGPLAGFEFFDINLVDYAPSLTFVHGGTLNESIDVRFVPTVVQSYDGIIPVTGGGASASGAAVIGAGINTLPTVTTGTISAITSEGATVGGSYGDNGCNPVTAFGVVYSSVNGFDPATGTVVSGNDLGGGTWESVITGLDPCGTYYVRAFATSLSGTAYGAQASFTVAPLAGPVATSATAISGTGFTANWNPVPGATGYVVDVSTLPSFAVENFGQDLFFSEYIEGSSSNKYIEIYNPTGAAIDLSDYQLRLYSNGSPTASATNTLSGTLASGATVVYRNNAANIAGTSGYQVLSAVNWNGDDAIGLWKISASANVDIFGEIGVDPGTAWIVSGTTTLDRTLVRNSSVTGGNTVNGAGFPTLGTQWTMFPLDNVANLGTHTSVVPSIVPSFVPGYEAVPVAGTSLAVTGLTVDQTYYYRVRAVVGSCVSGNSNTISATTCDAPVITSIVTNSPFCGADGLSLTVNATGSPALAYEWSGTGSFVPDNASASVTVNGAASGPYSVTVTNACGSASDDVVVVVSIPGTACNDGNPNTVLDVLDGTCTCVGQTCTTDLVLEVNTDANGTQTTWEIRTTGTNVLVQSGGGTYPNNATLTDNTCLPDGCYYLRVFDAGGDGIVGGGYILRTLVGAHRIIDNRGNGGNFTSVSAVINNGGFCLPLGTDKLIFTSCDKLDWVNNQFIVAAENPAVSAQFGVTNTTSGYQFWWFDPNGTYGYAKFRSHATSDGFGTGATRACHARINNWSPNQIPANVLMNVKVRSRVAGVNSNWGPVCRFMIDPVRAACPLTKLMDIPGNAQYSCGVTRTWGGSSLSKVVAKAVDGATQYQFRWNNAELAAPVIRTTTTPVLQLNWSPALPNGTYQVQVRAFKNGVWCIT